MKVTTIVAALLGASVTVSASVLPRTEPECEEESGTPSTPAAGRAPYPYSFSKGNRTYGVYTPTSSTPVSPVVPIGTGTYSKPVTPVSPVHSPPRTGKYGATAAYGGSAAHPYGGGSPYGVYAPISTGSPIPEYGTNGPQGGNKSLICGATSLTNHTVASGETLTKIAQNYSSGICDIVKLNKIKNPNFITVGQVLEIPVHCKTPDDTSCLPPVFKPTETCVPGLGSTHNVVSGDTLSNIANEFNITLASVIAANPKIKNPDLINIGQVINIPICPHSQCDIVGTYTIKSGDLFVDLATKYHTTIGQIKSLNLNVDPTKTQPGDIIILPQQCHNVTTS